MILAWWLVAHTSGQGWVQALGDVVAAGILTGLIGPWLALRRLRVEVIRVPGDAVAGRPVEVEVRTNGATRITPLSVAGSPRTDGPLVLLPAGRGVHTFLLVEIATAAPFGLQWWRRPVTLALPRPLHVAPRRGNPWDTFQRPPNDGDERHGPARHHSPAGDLRAARPYRSGDPRQLVHWPATAHTGELMVRELEQPGRRPTELVVNLPADPAAAEAAAERAYGTVLALLERAVPVILTTREATGVVTAEVENRRDAGRRLAAAL